MAGRIVSKIIGVDVYLSGCTLCISDDGHVYSFGSNNNGAHGHTIVNVPQPRKLSTLSNIISISCGLIHTVCIDIDGNIFTFGNNKYGQLGIGIDKDILEHTHEPQKVNLPPIKQVSCGYKHTICISDIGELFSFGGNDSGQLGIGSFEDSNFPQKIQFPNEEIQFFECGIDYVICKTVDNIYFWGSCENGKITSATTPNSSKLTIPFRCTNWPEDIVDIKCGIGFNLVLTSKGTVYSSGNNYNGQLGRNTSDRYSNSLEKIENLPEILRIECGFLHSMCLDVNDNLYIFGANSYGQLGIGNNENRIDPTKHPLLSNIIDISSKGFHTFVKTSSNEIFAFGSNQTSQIGIETKNNNQLLPVQVLKGKEKIWYSSINSRRAKSARN